MIDTMDLNGVELDEQVTFYRSISFAPNTKKAYSVHRKTYLSFCEALGQAPVPASSQLLCQYAAYLARRLKYRSIRQYMNIIRILHCEWGLPNPCVNNYLLNSTLRGIRRHLGDTVTRKAPITPNLLKRLLSQIDVSTVLGASVWAAALLMFFGLLRRSNVMSPETGFDPQKHLRRSDLCFNPKGLEVRIRWSKTLQFKEEEFTIPYPWDRQNPLCPTQAVFNALRLSPRAPRTGPALVLDNTENPTALTPLVFIREVRNALRFSAQNVNDYAGHSFRRGGSTWAFQQNISVDRIKLLGRWKSDAYSAYILPTDSGLAQTTAHMLAATKT